MGTPRPPKREEKKWNDIEKTFVWLFSLRLRDRLTSLFRYNDDE